MVRCTKKCEVTGKKFRASSGSQKYCKSKICGLCDFRDLKGIYCFRDKENDREIVYIGKDSNIYYNRRYKAHLMKSNNGLYFSRELKKNPDRYEYEILKKGKFNYNLLNALEIIYIKRYTPKFNFTRGGDGSHGYIPSYKKKHVKYKNKKYAHIVKYGKSKDGQQIYCIAKNGNYLKISISRSKLLNWFTKEYPKEILILTKV